MSLSMSAPLGGSGSGGLNVSSSLTGTPSGISLMDRGSPSGLLLAPSKPKTPKEEEEDCLRELVSTVISWKRGTFR